MIIITLISIFAITGIVLAANKILPFKICPICAGVSGTWLWMLAANFAGYPIDLLIPALLIGGSVVGIAYQVEKRLPPNRPPLLWKALFIPMGFAAAYSLISSWWGIFSALLAVLLTLALIFVNPFGKIRVDKKAEELEKKMEKCC